MVANFLPSLRGFGFRYFQKLGKKMAIEIYLASSLALPATLILYFHLDCCLDRRRENQLFGNFSALFTYLIGCWWQRCWQMLTASTWIGNIDKGLNKLVQVEKVQCFLGIWYLLSVLFQGVHAHISTQKITPKWEPGHSSSLSPAPNYTAVVSWWCVASALLWVRFVPKAPLKPLRTPRVSETRTPWVCLKTERLCSNLNCWKQLIYSPLPGLERTLLLERTFIYRLSSLLWVC